MLLSPAFQSQEAGTALIRSDELFKTYSKFNHTPAGLVHHEDLSHYISLRGGVVRRRGEDIIDATPYT